MRAVIYARYSSDNQREESIEGQLRECNDYAEFNHIEVVGNYIDRAYSAKTDHRPEFQRMIKDSAKNFFDTIIVWKLDRFSRNRYDSARYKHLLKKNGVKVVSAKETIAEGSEGILLESLLEGMAEYYSADLAEKVKRGMTENAKKGKTNGVPAPFGYYVDENDRFQIDEKTALIVREIFELYVDGKRTQEIKNILNARGIKNRNYPFSYNTVFRILTNRKYMGEYKFGDIVIPNGVPAIIDEKLFEKAQTRMKINKRAPAMHRSEDDYLLTPKLFCGKCGALMTGAIGRNRKNVQYRYYRCNRAEKKECDKKSVRKEWIESQVIDCILEILKSDKILDEIATRIYEMQTEESFLLKSLQDQLDDTKQKLKNIVTAIENGVYSDTTKERLDELEAQKKVLEAKIGEEQHAHPVVPQEEIFVALQNYKRIDISTKEGKQKLIDAFVNSIYLYDDRFVITFNYKDQSKTVSLEEIECLPLTSQVSPKTKQATRKGGLLRFYSPIPE